MPRSSVKVSLGWYVMKNGEQVAWYYDRKRPSHYGRQEDAADEIPEHAERR